MADLVPPFLTTLALSGRVGRGVGVATTKQDCRDAQSWVADVPRAPRGAILAAQKNQRIVNANEADRGRHNRAVSEANPAILDGQISKATAKMTGWLRGLPEWPSHPANASGTVSAHFGPTVLSEHDCVMHYARFLHESGLAWEDIHLELSPGQWMYNTTGVAPKRIDLAIVQRDRLAAAGLPAPAGGFALDAVFEFALASNYWQFGAGSPRTLLTKVNADVSKVAEYLRAGLAIRGYVVVVEECDHSFAADYAANALPSGVQVLILRRWRTD